ncbi:TPA: right-handed parallel beta-helix repeat-containing protein, partial [Candidatus Micrarchaeota archaeon]|nr:right-handed parallel beta-helix repeat-containing protein [Candidatus Micrarchaeota archaeon]
FYSRSSQRMNLTNLTSFANYQGIHLYDTGEVIGWNTHLYNNTIAEFNISTAATARSINFTNMSLDQPDGRFRYQYSWRDNYAPTAIRNVTWLNIIDSVEPNTAYSLNWAERTYAGPLPAGRIYFRNKAAVISTLQGAVSIDHINWTWMFKELHGYYDNRFELWNYDGGVWTQINNSPNTFHHTMGQYGLNPSGIYAVLQNTTNISGCRVINNPGRYVLHTDAWGSVSVAGIFPPVRACIFINQTSDVEFDCMGHRMRAWTDGIGGAYSGFFVYAPAAGQWSNITIKNCKNVFGATAAVWLLDTSGVHVDNVTSTYNSAYNFYLERGVHNSNFSGNFVDCFGYGSGRGFMIYRNSSNNTFFNNTVHECDNGFYSYRSSYNKYLNNSVNRTTFRMWSYGFHMTSDSDFNRMEGNLVHSKNWYDHISGPRVGWDYGLARGFSDNAGHSNHYKNNTIYRLGRSGIRLGSSTNCTVENNIVHSNREENDWAEGAFGAVSGRNNTFRNNLVYNYTTEVPSYRFFWTNDTIVFNNTLRHARDSDAFSIQNCV